MASARKALLWLVRGVAICLAAVGAFWLLGAVGALPSIALFGTESETRDTQVVNSITRQEQVVLLGLGIQGIAEESAQGTFLGMGVPGSERTSFIQYNFNAKLGIDGQDVEVTQTGEDAFLISIPEFIFIGHDDMSFKLAAVNNDILSWTTPEIDTVDMINEIINDDTKEQYVDANEELLRDQAKVFYAGIITSVDPLIAVEFEFRDQ